MLALLLAAMLQPVAPDSEEARVAEAAAAMLEALGRGDKAAMTAAVLPGATATVTVAGKSRTQSMADFIARLPSGGPKLEERLYEPRARVDGDVAGLWALYDFRIDGKVSHCGADLFAFVRENGTWKISSITWNQRKDCPER